ncbi:hypothetical protein DERF_015917 [Dermatophagoides farinae]|uniref:Uncharacterized protein n=1 Tax=Dermatophagoides farinae TaxID=6954 RepID=A0A922KRS8_DERFA|nr:hypothetical protein DERF_015917 [Dermatophagoides farinae]
MTTTTTKNSNTTAPNASPNTLTTVRKRSNIKSTTITNAASSNDKPIEFNTTTVVIIPACGIPAAPILTNMDVIAIVTN